MRLELIDNPEKEINYMYSHAGIMKLIGSISKTCISKEDMLRKGMIFLRVIGDDNSEKGWFMLDDIGNKSFILHTYLRTLGKSTKIAYARMAEWAHSYGFRTLITYFPKGRKSLESLVQYFRMTHVSDINPDETNGLTDTLKIVKMEI